MSQMVLSRPMFEGLSRHLIDIEAEKRRILNEYYPKQTEERERFQFFIGSYINNIRAYIANAVIDEAAGEGCPFVIIGSIVEVEDLEYGETEKIQIVSPFTDSAQTSWACASYLSPIGKALLLKKVEEKVEVETPAGKTTYRVRSIVLPF